MENGESMNAGVIQGSVMSNTFDQRDHHGSDVMARRLKNRERQRRYRARKRLEADMKRSSITNHSTRPPVDLHLNGNGSLISNGVARVYCKRNWKKDARRAPMSKYHEGELTLAIKSPTILPSENKADAQALVAWESHPSFSLVSCETSKPKLGRRDWKADARKKKT